MMKFHKYHVSPRNTYRSSKLSVTSLEREHRATQATDCVTSLRIFREQTTDGKEDVWNTELKGTCKYI